MWPPGSMSWIGSLDDLPPIGETLVGCPTARHRESAVFDLRVLRVASVGTSLVPVRFRGMGEERGAAGPRGTPGLRWLRIGVCTPPAERLRPQAVRGRQASPRVSAIARGVGHLHESTVTGGHHDGPDNFTPLILPSARRLIVPDGIPPGRRTRGRAQPAAED